VDAGIGLGHIAAQATLDKYRPIFDSRLATDCRLGLAPVFTTLEDAVW
jgi:hypothetical protein